MNLADKFVGKIFWQNDEAYEEARVGRIFNARRPKRFPEAVLFAANEHDVVLAVKMATQRGWKIAVRSGGHSWAAWSVRDKGLLIDLSLMKEMQLDESTGIVRVNPAVQGGMELAPYLESHGRMFAGGHCPTVGLGGFLLQGGMGWNCRGWGWAAEQIVAIDVVNAAGELLRADANQNQELYWAARGAGPGFFAVVTNFYLQTRAMPKALSQTTLVFPIETCEEVLAWLQDTHARIDTRVELVALSLTPPNQTQPVMVVHGVAMVNNEKEAQEALALLAACPFIHKALVQEIAQPTSFAAERKEQIQQNPEGCRYAADNAWLVGSTKEVAPRLRELFTTLPTTKTFALWFSMAPLRPLPDMALSLQTDIYLAVYTVWDDESDDVRCRTWLQNQMQALGPINVGQYLGDSDFLTRNAKFVSNANWQKLEALRAKHDPQHVFHGYLSNNKAELNKNPGEA